MSRAMLHWSRVGVKASFTPIGLALLTMALSACSVETLQPQSRPAVPNSCDENADCGTNGICTNGTCYSRIGNIDEVLLEILPEATSPLAGISFLSMQDNVRRGDRSRSIALSGPVTFPVQVVVNGEDLADGCPYLRMGKQTVAARIRFDRTGSVGGVSVGGLSDNFTVTVNTEQGTSGFSKEVSLVPGYYNIYAQPVSSPNCQIAAKVWRGVAITRDVLVAAWAPPATLDLPKPLTLNGRVERRGGVGATLADWQVEILDPQDGKVISTSARLGATTDAAPVTNFTINYQPTEQVVNALESSLTNETGPTVPLIRLRPPKDAESAAPTVYFDLAAAAPTGDPYLILSSLPTASQLVTVSGQVRGTTGDPVRATVKFLNALDSRNSPFAGLPAAFGPAVSTDGAGNYTTKLFPGGYRIVVIPEGATDTGGAVPGANAARQWALTERHEIVGLDPTQVVDLAVLPVRVIEGVASAGRKGVVAQGATLEAAPLISSSSDVLRAVIEPPIAPARSSIAVNDNNGQFSLVLDPGDYDLTLKPAAASNFAWWILPKQNVYATNMPGQIGTLEPQLLYPVPLEGTITVGNVPLRNATVQAYARSTRGNVVKVGTARTDDMGHYYLALPPEFASLQP
jgi:hypothetical protein